jgi:hypothetical protein
MSSRNEFELRMLRLGTHFRIREAEVIRLDLATSLNRPVGLAPVYVELAIPRLSLHDSGEVLPLSALLNADAKGRLDEMEARA